MPPLDWMDARAVAGGAADDARDPAGPDARSEAHPGAQPGRPLRDAPELLEGLNEAQREAVTHGDGPLLILAGAGSGKTRAITSRIAWLVTTGRCAASEILAITFTNKAAGEMRSRVQRLIDPTGSWVSTFHSMCARILRREIEVLGGWTRDFTIYDTHDRNQLIKRIVKDAGYDPQRFRAPALGAILSDGKNRARVGAQGEAGGDDGEGLGIEEEVVAAVRERYERAMREQNALDFDDLLLKTVQIFDEHPGIRDAYASRFRYVLVDEYQDTNRVQYLLTRHLAGYHGNLAVCGDPDQSIYAWRGADIRNILDFEQDFGTARVVKLERNYRSKGNILKAAQSVVRHNVGRKEKDLYTEDEDGPLLCVLECGDENDEASEICQQVQALQERGADLDGIAVFYRVNWMQRALERAFRLSGVPYQIVGGVEFYQRREVRDLIAYLQLLVNPRDDIAFRRVVNVPARGVGDKSLEKLTDWARARGVSLREAVASEEARATIRGRAKGGLAAFAQLLDNLEDAREGPAAPALEQVIDEIEYYDYLSSLSDADMVDREENVEELVAHARTYDESQPEVLATASSDAAGASTGLRGFLQDVALVSDVDGFEDDAARVVLMTLHSAKGLEFPYVFIAGAEEQLLPHAMALAEGEDDGVEEERRLLYVGMTRARERLFLTWARYRLHFGETLPRTPSRFLDEIPAELIEGGRSASDDADAGEDLGAYDAPDGTSEVREGDLVEHEHFGRGRVERLQGAGINARATVQFDHVGSKVLLLQYARLDVVGR